MIPVFLTHFISSEMQGANYPPRLGKQAGLKTETSSDLAVVLEDVGGSRQVQDSVQN